MYIMVLFCVSVGLLLLADICFSIVCVFRCLFKCSLLMSVLYCCMTMSEVILEFVSGSPSYVIVNC